MFMGLHCVCTGELSCLLGWYARVLLMHVHSGQDSLFLPTATKVGQGNIFTGICLSAGGRGVCLSACWDMPNRPDTNPPRSRPLEQTHPPRSRHPPEQTTPGSRPHPRQEADFSIRSTSGRYASYWNAFLFYKYPCNCPIDNSDTIYRL